MTMTHRPEPRPVPGLCARNSYGARKAKRHAQAEANRIGRRVYLQLDEDKSFGTYPLVTVDFLMLPNHPFFTYYPEAQP